MPGAEHRSGPEWRRLRRLFSEAIALDGNAQTVFLERLCRGDDELAQQLRELLKAARMEDQQLDNVIAEASRAVLQALDPPQRPADAVD